ncbi:MAG: methionine--tRNA ligase [Patescibacteria group bacterium]
MNKFYITTSIAYVNAAPHLGFALELIQADIIARFQRNKGNEVFFLTGTDEHGAKIVKAAEAAGKNPKDFVDENAAKFEALKNILNISWDDFIRTSDQNRHWLGVVSLWNKLVEAGDIYKKNYRGLYCVGHEAFVTEKDLVNGKCRDHNKEPEIIEEENYFFKLSKYALQVRELIANGELLITPEGRAREIINFIDQGVEDISFSRPRKDLSWGVPVPGDDTQTIYVWADALSNYLYPKNQWPADLHCIGKDILRFHALFWPAMLLSAKLNLPKSLFVHGHITVDGQKMSKTLGNVVDPVELVKKYGADAVRYYLLREIPSTDDGDFSYKKFEERYNADLANGLGNFTARVLTLAAKLKDNESRSANDEIKGKIKLITETINEKMQGYKFNEALAAIWELIAFGDAYVNEKKPWESKDAVVIGNLIFLLENIADLLKPFLPETAEKISESVKKKIKINLFPRV